MSRTFHCVPLERVIGLPRQALVVAKHGQPVFVAVPFSDRLLLQGVNVARAVKLPRDHTVSLGRATQLAGMAKMRFIALLGAQGIAAVE